MQIAVFCGSSTRIPEEHLAMASALGAEIARRGHVLVYGGCRTGSMGALADGAIDAGGRVVGVVLQRFVESDLHHRGLDELSRVVSLNERKSALSERAQAFIVLPGGIGTLEELIEVLALRKIGAHEKPVALLDDGDFFAGLRLQLERGIAGSFDRPKLRDFFAVVKDPVAALGWVESAADAAAR